MLNHPLKTQLYMKSHGKKPNETENEFPCSKLRLHNLVSSKVQNSVGVSGV